MLSKRAYRVTIAGSAVLTVMPLLVYFTEDVGSIAAGSRWTVTGCLLLGAIWNGLLCGYFLRPSVKAQFK